MQGWLCCGGLLADGWRSAAQAPKFVTFFRAVTSHGAARARLALAAFTLEPPEAGWVQVSTQPLPLLDGARLHAEVLEPGGTKRFVSVLRYRAQLFCLDSVCYHAGGPLTAGDIEDCGGEACVLCPWHAYPVSLRTGDKLYRATEKDPDGRLVPAGWKSVGKRQRVHEVQEWDGGVFVRLALGGESHESDSYAHNTVCGQRCTASHAAPSQRSGSVLAGARNLALHSSRGGDGRAI